MHMLAGLNVAVTNCTATFLETPAISRIALGLRVVFLELQTFNRILEDCPQIRMPEVGICTRSQDS